MRRLFFIPLVGLGLVYTMMISQNDSSLSELKAQQNLSAEKNSLLKQFGIVGDNKTDCSGPIQQAIDASVGSLFFPRGVYRLSKTVTIDLSKVGPTSLSGDGTATFIMSGPGPAFRFKGTHGGTASPKTFKPEVWLNERSPMVDGIEIVGDHPEATGIEAKGTMQMIFSRVVVRKALHGIHLVDRNRNVIVSECHLYENNGIGLYLEKLNLHQINVCNSHISYNAGGGIVLHESQIRNLQIGTCDIEGNMGGPDSKPTANILIDSTGSSVAEVAIVGCTIQHSHNAPHSANIRINNQSLKRSITDELRTGNITIADNVLSDVRVNIEVKNARGVTITGNTLWKGYDYDMVIENCANMVIANNVFDRNPRYHYSDGADSKHGVLITNSADSSFSGNLIKGTGKIPAAVIVNNCTRMNITGCTILDYMNGGLFLQNVTHSRVSDCLIRKNPQQDEPAFSIKNENGKGNMIVDNLIDAEN